MTTTTVTYTPWGWTKNVVELAEGVWRVSTPSHGGLKLSRERWDSLPAELRDAMYTPTFAEEDCEEPIVRTLLGLGDECEREMALKVAGYFDRYTPALPYLRDCPPGVHRHVISYWAATARIPSSGSTPASRPSRSPTTLRWCGSTGGWRPSSARARGRSAGRKGDGHDHEDTGQAPQPSQHHHQAPDRDGKPVRDRLDGRGRRALRGLRIPGQGREFPARRYRAGLPVDLPAPAARDPGRGDHRPDAPAYRRWRRSGTTWATAGASRCSASATASPTSSRDT